VFRTSSSRLLDEAARAGEITQGWHPNFLPGSSHGADAAAVVEWFRRELPGARTARSHCFAEDTASWRALAAAGIVADSQLATRFQAGIAPIVHWTGIVRLPIYFEDDLFFEAAPDELALDAIAPTLFSPGLKVLDFHPTFVAINAPSRPHYERVKPAIFGSAAPAAGVIFDGRGTRDVLRELLDRIAAAGHALVPFEEVVSRVLAGAAAACPPGM
jgi:hypothetical protein